MFFLTQTMSFNIGPSLLTVSEIAAMLRLSTITIYKYIHEKELEAVEFGGHYRVSVEALQKFLEKHKVSNTK